MIDISKETIALLQYLLPGFLAAWVFYGLTSHIKPNNFERVAQALIFTLLVQTLNVVFKSLLIFTGKFYQISIWNNSSELISTTVLAVLVGAFISLLTNKDWLHEKLRDYGFTARSSHPSEWYISLSNHDWYVVLHFKDEKRLIGYPKTWPSEPEKGHFFIMQPAWLDDAGNEFLLNSSEGLLINVSDVRWVEFIRKETTNESNSAADEAELSI